MLNCDSPSGLRILLVILCTFLLAFSLPSIAQTTLSTGSISGTVTDPSGAVVSGAKVTITNVATSQKTELTSNASGVFSSGPLSPGTYKVQVSAKGFSTVSQDVVVQVGNTATINPKLTVGQESTVVEVQGSAVQVNTEQPTVQGVLTANQIENLPVNGRNFLDLAQLEPGVQIQDGQNFDPTKAGYSSISFGGRFGRTARIEVDGVDVSDETVGTTTQDIPASAIQEFQISQSSLDMSTELTSSGAVNVTTKSGTNSIHGQAFGQFRDSSVGAAALPGGANPPYQRNQYGGAVGGPIIKNKMFFFADGERTIQHTQVPVVVSAPFDAYKGSFSDPFHEGELLGKVDYQLPKNAHAFYRFSYFKNSLGATFGLGFSLYDNVDITRNHVLGLDFNTGSFTHSVRFSFLKFQNQIVDKTTGNTALPFNDLQAEIFMGGTGLIAGPNLLAPQSTPQSNHEIKYDGTKIWRSHVIRFGASFNHVQGGGFASFYKNGPLIISAVSTGEENDITAAGGDIHNPLSYPADSVTIANGLGFSTIKPALGFPAGGLGPDNRLLLYLGDTWKIKPNFALTYGLRYERDTGRTDNQYAPIPELSALLPGLGNRVNQPNSNFAPQVGFAWDPSGRGKTSIRGGVGLFYENAIWNNVLFDGPFRERTGAFLQAFAACANPGQETTIPVSGNTTLNAVDPGDFAAVCAPNPTTGGFQPIGSILPNIVGLQAAYQANSPLDLQAPNPAYAGQYLTDCSSAATNCDFAPVLAMFAPNYKSPRSVQMNIGIQHELRRGMVISADYIRNVQTHFLLGVDQNHAGDVRYFDPIAAGAAIDATNASFGCGAGPGGVDCAQGKGATMSNYAGNGLGSSADMGGLSCYAALGRACAFGGVNPLAPPLPFLVPVGRSVYSGLQAKFIENVQHPFAGAKTMNFQVSYALSRFENSGGGVGTDASVTASSSDQDFIVPALDNHNVNRYFGPSTLDRTHQVSFGGYVSMRGGFQLGIMSHFYSPLSTTLTVPDTTQAGEIFRTDFTGDGTTQDVLPGTHVGNFMRGINASNINTVISKYNANFAGQATPAGNVLVQNNLMTPDQLVALGAVAPTVPAAPANQVNMGWLHAFDATLSYSHTIKERFTIQPSIAFFNLFNFSNFDLPTSMMSGLLAGSAGTINGTGPLDHETNRVGVGTGVFTLGSPRELEFGLKLTF